MPSADASSPHRIRDGKSGPISSLARARLACVRPAPDLLLLGCQGRLDLALAKQISKEVGALVSQGIRPHVWIDWSLLTGYESDARLHLTEVASRSRHLLGSVHLLLGSRVVAMGVSVANLATGGLLNTYLDLPAWDLALGRVLPAARELEAVPTRIR